VDGGRGRNHRGFIPETAGLLKGLIGFTRQSIRLRLSSGASYDVNTKIIVRNRRTHASLLPILLRTECISALRNTNNKRVM
jgi:hypothetical protein